MKPRLIAAACLATTGAIVGPTQTPATPSFEAQAQAIARTVGSGSLKRIRAVSAPTIQIREFCRVYAHQLRESAGVREAFRSQLLPKQSLKPSADDRGNYSLVMTEIDWKQPLQPDDRVALTNFSKLVRTSFKERPFHFHASLEDSPSEVPIPAYPAISCPLASNQDWRIVLRKIGKSWRISAVEIGTH